MAETQHREEGDSIAILSSGDIPCSWKALNPETNMDVTEPEVCGFETIATAAKK